MFPPHSWTGLLLDQVRAPAAALIVACGLSSSPLNDMSSFMASTVSYDCHLSFNPLVVYVYLLPLQPSSAHLFNLTATLLNHFSFSLLSHRPQLIEYYVLQAHHSNAMAALSVPQQGQPQTTKTLTNQTSMSSLRRNNIEHTDNLVPLGRSRRNSALDVSITPLPSNAPSAGAPQSAAARAGLVPQPDGLVQAADESNAVNSSMSPMGTEPLTEAGIHAGKTTLYIGKRQKPVHIPTDMLKEKSPYFKRMLSDGADVQASTPRITFEDLDEFGMGLFMHWLQSQGQLHGPHDFHSLAHYLSLYVVARKFEVEPLENQGTTSHPVTLLHTTS